jgi:hypothetical protein
MERKRDREDEKRGEIIIPGAAANLTLLIDPALERTGESQKIEGKIKIEVDKVVQTPPTTPQANPKTIYN